VNVDPVKGWTSTSAFTCIRHCKASVLHCGVLFEFEIRRNISSSGKARILVGRQIFVSAWLVIAILSVRGPLSITSLVDSLARDA
jgi:hypothetical protein